MLRYFKEYLCVGGLPYVVSRFVETNDMNVVWQEQQDILEEYKDDFGKHLDENENEEIDRTLLGRINRVFDSIPAQLAKENNKFVYSQLEKKGRSENYQTAIQWLYDCGIINICHNLTNIADCFSKQGRKLFYFRKESGLEIDFVENVGGELAIIEVKATTGRSKSAKIVLSNDNYAAKVCYKLSENNIGVAGKMVTLPYYMAMFLE